MHAITRVLALSLLALTAAACGGDSTGPEPYPDVSGTYAITGDFDGLSSAADWSGSLQLTTPDERGAFSGVMTVALEGGGGTFLDEVTGTVSRDGTLRFEMRDASGSWEFTGTADGGALRGRHSLESGADVLRGDWLAVRR